MAQQNQKFALPILEGAVGLADLLVVFVEALEGASKFVVARHAHEFVAESIDELVWINVIGCHEANPQSANCCRRSRLFRAEAR